MSDIGYCKYCNEMLMIECPDEAIKEEKNKIATKYCKCEKAEYEAKKELEIEKAKQRIQQLFGEEAEKMGFDSIAEEDIHNLMNFVVFLIANKKIRGTTIEINGMTKAKISISSKGKINIERAQAIKYKLEA